MNRVGHPKEGCRINLLRWRSGVYNVSRERIRQIEVRAFEKLQKRMQELARQKGMLETA